MGGSQPQRQIRLVLNFGLAQMLIYNSIVFN